MPPQLTMEKLENAISYFRSLATRYTIKGNVEVGQVPITKEGWNDYWRYLSTAVLAVQELDKYKPKGLEHLLSVGLITEQSVISGASQQVVRNLNKILPSATQIDHGEIKYVIHVLTAYQSILPREQMYAEMEKANAIGQALHLGRS